MEEALALQFVRDHEHERFVCPDGTAGTVCVLEDMNCCCPTDNVLFAFVQDSGRRKVMTAAEFLEFVSRLS